MVERKMVQCRHPPTYRWSQIFMKWFAPNAKCLAHERTMKEGCSCVKIRFLHLEGLDQCNRDVVNQYEARRSSQTIKRRITLNNLWLRCTLTNEEWWTDQSACTLHRLDNFIVSCPTYSSWPRRNEESNRLSLSTYTSDDNFEAAAISCPGNHRNDNTIINLISRRRWFVLALRPKQHGRAYN